MEKTKHHYSSNILKPLAIGLSLLIYSSVAIAGIRVFLDTDLEERWVAVLPEDLHRLETSPEKLESYEMARAHEACSLLDCEGKKCVAAIGYHTIEREDYTGKVKVMRLKPPKPLNTYDLRLSSKTGGKIRFFSRISCTSEAPKYTDQMKEEWRRLDPELLSMQMKEILNGGDLKKCSWGGATDPSVTTQALKVGKTGATMMGTEAYRTPLSSINPTELAVKGATYAAGNAISVARDRIEGAIVAEDSKWTLETKKAIPLSAELDAAKLFILKHKGLLSATPELRNSLQETIEQAEKSLSIYREALLKERGISIRDPMKVTPKMIYGLGDGLEPTLAVLQEEFTEKNAPTLPEPELNLAAVNQAKAEGISQDEQRRLLAEAQTMKQKADTEHKRALDELKAAFSERQEAGKTLRNTFKKLQRSLAIPFQPITVDVETINSRCEEELVTRPSELRNRLIGMARGFATETRKSREFHLYYGEYGNGKSTAVEDLARCSGVPFCKFTSDQLRAEWRKRVELNASKPASLASSSKEDSTGSNTLNLSAMVRDLVTSCMIDHFKDKEGKPTSTGVILFDDYEDFIEKTFPYTVEKEGEKVSEEILESRRQRRDFFNLIKEMTDQARATFIDPVSGIPVKIGGIRLFATSNSVPMELNPANPQHLRPLFSRTEKYLVPVPSEDDRKYIVERRLEKFYKEIEKKYPNYQITPEQMEVCQKIANKILAYDLAKFKTSRNRLGVRALIGFLGDFSKTMSGKFLEDSQNGTRFGCQDTPGKSFNVEDLGSSKEDYKKLATDEIEEAKFLAEVSQIHDTYVGNKSSFGSTELKTELEKMFEKIRDSESESLEERRKKFGRLQEMMSFALNTIDFSGHPVRTRIQDEFQSHYSFLDRKESVQNLTALADVYNRMIDKLTGSKKKKNPIVLLEQKSEDIDPMMTVSEIADTFGLPVCRLTKETQLSSSVDPKWFPYRGELGSVVSVMVEGSTVYLEWDSNRRIYAKKHKGKIYVKAPGKPEEITVSEEELAQTEPKEQMDWVHECLAQWGHKDGGKQGIVILDIPDLKAPELAKWAEKISEVVNAPIFKDHHGNLVELGQVSTFILSKSNPEVGALLSKSGKIAQQTIVTGEIPPGIRPDFARSLVGKKLRPYEEKLLRLVIDYDRAQVKIARKAKMDLSVKPLKEAVGKIVGTEIQSRANDVLGLVQERDPGEVPPSYTDDLARFYMEFMEPILKKSLEKKAKQKFTRHQLVQARLDSIPHPEHLQLRRALSVGSLSLDEKRDPLSDPSRISKTQEAPFLLPTAPQERRAIKMKEKSDP